MYLHMFPLKKCKHNQHSQTVQCKQRAQRRLEIITHTSVWYKYPAEHRECQPRNMRATRNSNIHINDWIQDCKCNAAFAYCAKNANIQQHSQTAQCRQRAQRKLENVSNWRAFYTNTHKNMKGVSRASCAQHAKARYVTHINDWMQHCEQQHRCGCLRWKICKHQAASSSFHNKTTIVNAAGLRAGLVEEASPIDS